MIELEEKKEKGEEKMLMEGLFFFPSLSKGELSKGEIDLGVFLSFGRWQILVLHDVGSQKGRWGLV